MLPRLYDYSGEFSQGNGYGFFNKCKKCIVDESLNGEYFCESEISYNDRLIRTITPGQLVLAKPNHLDPPQFFEISKLKILRSGSAQFTAEHIKQAHFNQMTYGDAAENYSYTGTAEQVVSSVLGVIPNNTLFSVNVSGFDNTTHTLKKGYSVPTKLGDVFTGDNGIIELFGGEFHYDNYTVDFLKRRGTTTSKTIRYGANISDYTQTITNTDVVTSIYPYADVTVRIGDNSQTVRVYGDRISTGVIRTIPKTLTVDLTSKLKKKEFTYNSSSYPVSDLTAELNEVAAKYFARHRKKLTEPSVNITVTYQPELDKLQKVGLGDSVKVIYGPLNTVHTSRVIRTVYDSLRERYKEMEIGEKKLSLTKFLKASARR